MDKVFVLTFWLSCFRLVGAAASNLLVESQDHSKKRELGWNRQTTNRLEKNLEQKFLILNIAQYTPDLLSLCKILQKYWKSKGFRSSGKKTFEIARKK